MSRKMFRSRKTIWVIFTLLTIITSAEAQPFTYQNADLCLGFRKTGTYQGSYECVVDIGPAANYVGLAPGTTINITAYTASQIAPDSYANFTNLSWSVTGFTSEAGQPAGYPANTLWATVPRTPAGLPGVPAERLDNGTLNFTTDVIASILNGAVYTSGNLSANQDNTTTFVQEPYTVDISNNRYYGHFMEDPTYSTIGDLNGYGPDNTNGAIINLETTTVAPFTSGVSADFYELRPTGVTAGRPPVPVPTVDPHTGLTNGVGYNVGYFTLKPNGTMTFTRAAAPMAVFAGTPTNGPAPLTVVFNNTSTGAFTNSVWNFGNGTIITNATGGSVTNTYAAGGTYTVSLTVSGLDGTNTSTLTNYIVVSSASLAAGFAGTVTNGFAPLTVVFANTSTGSFTNSVWNFGNGTILTNTTGGNVTNTYAAGGNYTVSLAVYGSGGSSTNTQTGYIAASPTPKLGNLPLNAGKLTLSGSNGPVGVQYRILMATNLTQPMASWMPVLTNTIPSSGIYGYTNGWLTNKAAYFRLVSP
jgi:PKD repeat protein